MKCTPENSTELNVYSGMIVVVSLCVVTSLIAYYHVKGFKLIRYIFIFYLVTLILISIINMVFNRNGEFVWRARLIKLSLCIEIIYYLSILLTKKKKHLGLLLFAFAGLLFAFLRGQVFQLEFKFNDQVMNYAAVLIYIALIYSFYDEVPHNAQKTNPSSGRRIE